MLTAERRKVQRLLKHGKFLLRVILTFGPSASGALSEQANQSENDNATAHACMLILSHLSVFTLQQKLSAAK